MLKMRVAFAASLLALSVIAVPSVHAQQISPEFTGQLQTTLPSNEQLVGQIQDSMPATDLTSISDQTAISVATGENLLEHLSAASSLAPDDATRSRIEGVVTHTQAALDSLHMVESDSSVDSARGRLDQARAEAQEGLDELRPFVLGFVQSGAITGK